MSKYTGAALSVDFNSSAWSSNYAKKAETNESLAVVPSTGAGDTDETYLATLRDTDVTLDLWDDSTATTVWSKVEPSTTAATLNLYPQGNSAGKPKLTGSAYVTNRTRGVEFNGVVPVGVTLKVSGGLTESTI